MIHSRVILVASFSFLVLALASTSIAQTKQDTSPESGTLRKQIEEILDDVKLSRVDRLHSLRELIEREEAALTLKDVNRWLKDLASPTFQKRVDAEKNLINVGGPAVNLVEKTATGIDLEQTTRCLNILTKIAKSEEKSTSVAALKALERLSKSKSPIGVQAANLFAELSKTDKDRAIAAFEATGADVSRDSAGDVRSISSTTRDNFSDGEMKLLKYFPRISFLSVSGNNITDDGLEHISQLKSLRILLLFSDNITDKGLEHLVGLKALAHIRVSSTQVSNEGIAKLRKNLPNLRRVYLNSQYVK